MAIISFKRNLVFKIPTDITIVESSSDQYLVRLIESDDIDNDEWLKKDKKSLIKLIKKGHLGVVIFDKEKQKVAARGFIAINGNKPNHIPKIPEQAAWLHYCTVKDEYRGQGLQNKLAMFAIQLIRKISDKIDIYNDTAENNIPSRINQKKLGLIEDGIYTILKMGTQRFPYGYIQFGFWNKKAKHPELLDSSFAGSKHHNGSNIHNNNS